MIVVPQVAFHAQRVAMGEEHPPVRAVRDLVNRGAEHVALLDLDGSLAGDVLPQWAQALVAVANVPLWFDGRLHEGARIERIAKAGFGSIVVDQTAVFDPIILRWALDLYGPRLVVELQVDGEYVFDAPPHAYGDEVVDVVSALHVRGARRVLYRDVTGDAPSLTRLLTLTDRVPTVTIAYQGVVRDVEAVAELAELAGRVESVMVNATSILDEEFDLAAAMRIARGR